MNIVAILTVIAYLAAASTLLILWKVAQRMEAKEAHERDLGDWEAIGYDDAIKGNWPHDFQAPDKETSEAYLKGYERGQNHA